ncbi:MAG: helix-turn-helix domain-containing protein [Pseudomonadota bacterium]|nr:helix-turn-helix domain-containing protein [Pseudomonadota bacterium]
MRTRAELLEVTERLVASEGCEAVTTTRVAAESGVAVGTIYRYFPNREALLLGAYDATVERIAIGCAKHLADLEPTLEPQVAILSMIDCYLAAADDIPAHAPLLREMQRLRPVAEDRASDAGQITDDILLAFLRRYGLGNINIAPGNLAVVQALLSTLVDLYLVTEEKTARANIHRELQAHAILAFRRLRDQSPRKAVGSMLD